MLPSLIKMTQTRTICRQTGFHTEFLCFSLEINKYTKKLTKKPKFLCLWRKEEVIPHICRVVNISKGRDKRNVRQRENEESIR